MRIKLLLLVLLVVGSLTAVESVAASEIQHPAVPGPKATSMEGSWQAYFTRDGIVVGRPDVTYIFGKLGWAIREGAKEAVVQDWYKRDGDVLFLRPAEAPKDQPDMAITAACVGNEAFIINNPGPQGGALRFERVISEQPLPAAEMAKGTFRIIQTDFKSGEKRAASYTLTLHDDSRYTLDGLQQTTLPHAKGAYTLTGDILSLAPEKPSKGFWANPKFFLYHGKWVCNSRLAAVSLKLVATDVQDNAPAPVPPKAD